MKETFCSRCNALVKFENVSTGYFCVCPEHDEDLFEFETYQKETETKGKIMPMQCEQISNNHSNEKILVWIGEEVPWILCGYHAAQISNSLIEKIRDAGISYTPCIECDELIDTDTHTEELGMCVDCSNAYFTHDEENKTNLTLVIEGENK